MSGIVGIINWDKKPVQNKKINSMVDLIKDRGPDGVNFEIADNVAFGHSLLAIKKRDLHKKQPIWLFNKAYGIVGDIRIYNREEIFNKLDDLKWLSNNCPDAELILASYIKYGPHFLKYINGDFAFAIWDRKKNMLFAARDIFGIKPFYFSKLKDTFIFGSDLKPIRNYDKSLFEIDEIKLGEYIFDNYEEIERTFYKHIKRLIPAHYIICNDKGITSTKYWSPDPNNEIIYTNRSEYFDHFRHVFISSIKNRIDTDYGVFAQLSGGLDSSSIVILLDKLYKTNNNNLPKIQIISDKYGDLPCDESEYINNVLNRVAFDNVSFNPGIDIDLNKLNDSIEKNVTPVIILNSVVSPDFSDFSKNYSNRLIITGLGGDELLIEGYHVKDLISRRKYYASIKELFYISGTDNISFFKLLFRSYGYLAPDIIKRFYRRFKTINKWQPPQWANPEFVKNFREFPQVEKNVVRFSSLTQQWAYENLTSMRTCGGIETIEFIMANKGYELCHPFFDKKLAEFVLEIPFEFRVPTYGKAKYLLRASLKNDLPKEIISRTNKAFFNSYFSLVIERSKSDIKSLLFDNCAWLSEKYILRNKALEYFENFNAESDTSRKSFLPIWTILGVELWLRMLSEELKTVEV